jgi:SAM-dependent methyltransferase
LHGGSVLDVGCGGGAGSLPLVPPARRLVGVDQSAGMLAAYTAAATTRGATATTVQGRWPDVADTVPVADVVMCAHVIYNVADLVPFLRALTTHAATRVVLEFPTRHPLAWLTPYWQALHGLDRPTGPTAGDALAVMTDLGVHPHHEAWRRVLSMHGTSVDQQVDFIRARLALGVERADDVRQQIERFGVPAKREVVTAWWDV